MRNAKLEHTVSYWTARASMRILELENRCTGNRTVGSNPTLSASVSRTTINYGQLVESKLVGPPTLGGHLQTRCKHFGTALRLAYSESAFDQ
jgi:hypothetical protein